MRADAFGILEQLLGEVRRETGLDVRDDENVMARLETAALRAARDIARFGSAAVTLPALVDTTEGPYHLFITVMAPGRGEGAV